MILRTISLRALVCGFVLVLVTLGASVARADIMPPDVAECRDKKPGASCASGTGRCEKSECGRVTPRGRVTWPCMRCVPRKGGSK